MLNFELSFFQIISIGLFGFIVGSFEALTNFYYLITKNIDIPRKQHGKELPLNATNTDIRKKVVQMLFLGIFLLVTSIISLFLVPQLFVFGSLAIFLNGLIDYRKFKKTDMMIVWIFIALIVGCFSLLPLR